MLYNILCRQDEKYITAVKQHCRAYQVRSTFGGCEHVAAAHTEHCWGISACG